MLLSCPFCSTLLDERVGGSYSCDFCGFSISLRQNIFADIANQTYRCQCCGEPGETICRRCARRRGMAYRPIETVECRDELL